MHVHLPLSVLLASSLAIAQTPTHISPAAAATALGNSTNGIPFACTPTAYPQVHSRAGFSSGIPTLVRGVGLRMGRGFANRVGATIDVELCMAASPNDAAGASSTFANNVTGTEV